MAGIFPAEDLTILAYNRVVKDLNGLSEEAFLEKLGHRFDITKQTNGSRIDAENSPCISAANGTNCSLVPAATSCCPIRSTGWTCRYFRNSSLGPILGIDDPRTDKRISFVGGCRGIDELETLVDSGGATVAFSLFPTTMDDLFTVSDMGEDHAAQIDVVRAQTKGRPLCSLDLIEMEITNLADLRRDYSLRELSESSIEGDPFDAVRRLVRRISELETDRAKCDDPVDRWPGRASILTRGFVERFRHGRLCIFYKL